MFKETLIRSKEKAMGIDMKELWEYRELLFFFVWRNLKIRYKQTFAGILWVLFQPLFAMMIFSLFFGKLARVPSEGVPYPLFVYIGLVFWNYYSFGITNGSESLVNNANIIQKVYFPRLIIPITSSLTGLIDLGISSLLIAVLMLYYKFAIPFSAFIYFPFLVFIVFMGSIGIGCFLASLNVKYRDIRYIVPFFIQIFMFLSPVIYSSNIAGGKFKYIFAINPISGAIETARCILLGIGPIDWMFLSISIMSALILFIFGISYFKRKEIFFVDYI